MIRPRHKRGIQRGFPISCRPPEKRRHYSEIPFSTIQFHISPSQISKLFFVFSPPLVAVPSKFSLPSSYYTADSLPSSLFWSFTGACLWTIPFFFFYLFRLSFLLFNSNFNPVYLAELLWCPWPASASGFLSLHRLFSE